MSVAWKDRRDTVAHWKFQHRLMAEQGFPAALYTGVGGKPRAYEHETGRWRISTCVGGRWKLEVWTGRLFYPRGYTRTGGYKIWSPAAQRFDTPLAVALWFNLVNSTWEYDK